MENPPWLLIGFVGFVLLVLVIRRLGQVSSDKARELLASGARVLDARSPAEYARDHLKGAANLPVNQVHNRIGRIEPERSKPILIYCLSGARSGAACRMLRGLGYTEVYNLGSIGRARKIIARKSS